MMPGGCMHDYKREITRNQKPFTRSRSAQAPAALAPHHELSMIASHRVGNAFAIRALQASAGNGAIAAVLRGLVLQRRSFTAVYTDAPSIHPSVSLGEDKRATHVQLEKAPEADREVNLGSLGSWSVSSRTR